MDPSTYDAIVVGGGPAGLSATLVLGRCRHRVLLCDAGEPRNARSGGLHCFLSRHGILPADFLAAAREELRPYDVTLERATVVRATRDDAGFEVTLADGARRRSRLLLLATGIVDVLPPLDGFDAIWGRSAFVCPYCDGWEVRDQALAAYGHGEAGARFALVLTAWSRDVTLFTNATGRLADAERAELAAHQVGVCEEPIVHLESDDGRLRGVRVASGALVPRSALFFSLGQRQRSDLAQQLGVPLAADGGVPAAPTTTATPIPGLFVAGDASRDVQLAIVAAAEGAEAALAMHKTLAAMRRSSIG
jgi:thioredoxin reductase